MVPSTHNKQNQPTILRGLLVLETVIQAKRPISATDLIDLLALPKPTVNRILQQLEMEGLLQREPVKRRYLPGVRAVKMAIDTLSHEKVGAARHAVLSSLAEKISETCNCAMRDGDVMVYFDRVEANWPYRIQLPVGSHLPLHCTASGKLSLAYMEPRQRGRLLKSLPMKAYTDNTLTDPEQLLSAVKAIKISSVGVDNEEFMAGMAAVAVPVFNLRDELCFTVSVHAPTARKPLDALLEYVPDLREAAAKMQAHYCSAIQAEENA